MFESYARDGNPVDNQLDVRLAPLLPMASVAHVTRQFAPFRTVAGAPACTTLGATLDAVSHARRRPPHGRDVNTVFQDYALFPHMTVRDNVEYGLRVRKVARAERRARADEALAMVRLEDYGSRKPAQLSGGQRQRVALARAIV